MIEQPFVQAWVVIAQSGVLNPLGVDLEKPDDRRTHPHRKIVYLKSDVDEKLATLRQQQAETPQLPPEFASALHAEYEARRAAEIQLAETQQERDREMQLRRTAEQEISQLREAVEQAHAREPYANEYDDMERAISEAFGWTQKILGLDDAGDDPDDLVSNLSVINERSRALQQRFAALQEQIRASVTVLKGLPVTAKHCPDGRHETHHCNSIAAVNQTAVLLCANQLLACLPQGIA